MRIGEERHKEMRLVGGVRRMGMRWPHLPERKGWEVLEGSRAWGCMFL
jgi:hypothetical protein